VTTCDNDQIDRAKERPFGHGSIGHQPQRPVPRSFPLFKRCEWLVSNRFVSKRRPPDRASLCAWMGGGDRCGVRTRVAKWESICSTRAALALHYWPTSSSWIDKATIFSVFFLSQALSFSFLSYPFSVSSSLFFSYRYSYSYSVYNCVLNAPNHYSFLNKK